MTLNNGRLYANSENRVTSAFDATSGSLYWSYSFQQGPFDASPVVLNNTVYLGSEYVKTVYALNTQDGSVRWSYVTKEDTLGVGAPLSVGANGRAYFVSWSSINGHRRNYLNILDTATGTRIRRILVGGDDVPLNNAPVIEEGVVTVGVGQGIYAFDAQNGKALWQHSEKHYINQIVGANGLLYLAGADGFSAFDVHSGTLRWSSPMSSFSGRFQAEQTVLYAIDYNGIIYALDALDGHMKWHTQLRGIAYYSFGPGRTDVVTNFVFLNTELYVGTKGLAIEGPTTLHALDRQSGTEDWYATLPYAGASSLPNITA